MKVDPTIARVQGAARAYVLAMDQTAAAIGRCAGISRERARGVLTTAIDQESAAFNALLAAVYDQRLLDLIAGFGAKVT